MRYPLIDFHGNCGSRDGDAPAAYRYSECRLAPIAEATLADIKKDTVDWVPNYSETEQEPVYLPGQFPNLLCNGTMGIAVALACNFAPHNLSEIMNAAMAYLEDKNIEPLKLCAFIKGPDFPTGGVIINQNELKQIYLTGKGKARIRGEYVVESTKNHDFLVFTSIPYKISKENLIEEIDKLCEAKEINGIAEIRDESNKQGVRFVIELEHGVSADLIAKQLYKHTDLETTFSVNQVALVGKTPKLMTFKDLIAEYVKHQEDVFMRKTKYDLDKVQARIHILQGLVKASENIDTVVQLIKRSPNPTVAKSNLMERFLFTEAQAQAILDLKLSKLAHIEAVALSNELQEKQLLEKAYLAICEDPSVAQKKLLDEFAAFKSKFGDARRTKIIQIDQSQLDEDKKIADIPVEDCVIVVTEGGNIKRVPASSFKVQKRNGVGIKSQSEVTNTIIKTNTIDTLMMFTTNGRVYRIAVNDIPTGTSSSRGTAIGTLISLEPKEKVSVVVSVDRNADKSLYIWFVTKNGLIKKTSLSEYSGIKRKTGIVATTIKEDDSIAKIFVSPDSHILIFTEQGMSLHFNGHDIGATSRAAIGVKGIALKENDHVVTAFARGDNTDALLAFNDGTMKKVPFKDFSVQNRAGRGLICTKDNRIIDAIGVKEDDNILVAGNTNIRIAVKDLPSTSRMGTSVKVIKGSNITAITKV